MTVKQKTNPTAAETVATCWGGDAPAWVLQLAVICDRKSQSEAAKRIKYSASLVNMVLKNRYAGDLNAVKDRVEKALTLKVVCPVAGEISGNECLTNQQARYNPSNHRAVALFVACRRCANNVTCKGKAS